MTAHLPLTDLEDENMGSLTEDFSSLQDSGEHAHTHVRNKCRALVFGSAVVLVCVLAALSISPTKPEVMFSPSAFLGESETACNLQSQGQGSVCRASASDNTVHGEGQASIQNGLTLQECKQKCTGTCTGIEFRVDKPGRCEIHTSATIRSKPCSSAQECVETGGEYECFICEAACETTSEPAVLEKQQNACSDTEQASCCIPFPGVQCGNWVLSASGGGKWQEGVGKLTFKMKDDEKCGGVAIDPQEGTATLKVNLTTSETLRLPAQGLGEKTFELMTVRVDDVAVADFDCSFIQGVCGVTKCDMCPVVQDAVQLDMAPGEHTIKVRATSQDGLYHQGAYFTLFLSKGCSSMCQCSD